ncbi:HAD family hydrolase [Streptomyces noursei]|uniref:HAD family hydrolase n=1 Tax=Streptomyces noursei TaxID=1971 RepID=UPI000998CFB1|nr:HAD family hydrolase [Streptomyces noursei]UWS71205.1 HAD-IA family hydrolase [Streptomyces noursei]
MRRAPTPREPSGLPQERRPRGCLRSDIGSQHPRANRHRLGRCPLRTEREGRTAGSPSSTAVHTTPRSAARSGTVRLPDRTAGPAGVLLDLDDTLVDFSGASPAALAEVLGPEADFTTWMALTDHWYPQFTSGQLSYQALERNRLAEMLTLLGRPVPGTAGLDELDARRKQAVESRLRLYPDVLPFVRRVRAAGYRVGVLSNSDGRQQRRRIAGLGLGPWLDAITVSGESGLAKPSPESFFLACDRLGTPPGRTVHIGDSLDNDAIGAQRAGLTAVWLRRETPDGSPAPAGIAVVTSLAALTH